MKVAYADPPYVGQSAKHYGRHEVNHPLLVAHLCDEFPDGWALSCSSSSLKVLLPLCPEDVRIGAWVKPFHVFKPYVWPAYAWEPVLFRGGRTRSAADYPDKGGIGTTPRDWVSVNIPLAGAGAHQPGARVAGQKPLGFCFWIFDLLNLRPGDDLVDIFPGSGAVGIAWARYGERLPLGMTDSDDVDMPMLDLLTRGQA